MKEFFQADVKLTRNPRKGSGRKYGLAWVLCAASAFCLTSVAGTVYVDNGLQSYTGHDGTSWATAYRTIQEGVNAAADGLFHFQFKDILSIIDGEGNGTPLQYSCLANPMDRGAW